MAIQYNTIQNNNRISYVFLLKMFTFSGKSSVSKMNKKNPVVEEEEEASKNRTGRNKKCLIINGITKEMEKDITQYTYVLTRERKRETKD